MKDIAIYGAGGFGKEIACLLSHINESTSSPVWNLIGYFDDGVPAGTQISHYGHVIGDMNTLNEHKTPIAIVFAIGSPRIIRMLVSKIENPLVDFPNIIAPNALFFDKESTRLGRGNIITFGCRLSCDTCLGDFNILNGCVCLGHDATLGSYNVLMPETRLSGEVSVGDGNLFGARSFVAQQIKIGTNTTIGAGSVVLRHTKDNSLYLGNPAKRIVY